MNPNDYLAQQQALLQNAQIMQWIYVALSLAFFLGGLYVTYLFYAALREIAQELRRFRVAFEMAEDAKTRASAHRAPEDSAEDK